MSGRYRPALLSSAGAGIGPDHKQLIAGGQGSASDRLRSPRFNSVAGMAGIGA